MGKYRPRVITRTGLATRAYRPRLYPCRLGKVGAFDEGPQCGAIDDEGGIQLKESDAEASAGVISASMEVSFRFADSQSSAAASVPKFLTRLCRNWARQHPRQ